MFELLKTIRDLFRYHHRVFIASSLRRTLVLWSLWAARTKQVFHPAPACSRQACFGTLYL